MSGAQFDGTGQTCETAASIANVGAIPILFLVCSAFPAALRHCPLSRGIDRKAGKGKSITAVSRLLRSAVWPMIRGMSEERHIFITDFRMEI